jgi:hypothetical protein
MKKLIAILGYIALTSNLFAQDAPPVQEIDESEPRYIWDIIEQSGEQAAKPEITRRIIRAVEAYAEAIAGDDISVRPESIAALSPYKDRESRDGVKYAVLWEGNIGSLRVDGTDVNIAIVTVGNADTFVVDPLQSSPVIVWGSSVLNGVKLVGNTADSMTLEGPAYDNDPMCCPSLSVRETVRVDEQGNWKVVKRKITEKREFGEPLLP